MNSEGTGTANDASVETATDQTIDQEDPQITLDRAVTAAQSKVDKLTAQLAGAKEALANAKAAQKGTN